MMKSKIDIYNKTLTIICVASVIFSVTAKDNIALRIVCAVAAFALFIGIIIKIFKGGENDVGNKA